MIEIFNWKSFTLIANVDNENDGDIQNIAKKLTINAIAKNLCVIVHDNDEEGIKPLFIFLVQRYVIFYFPRTEMSHYFLMTKSYISLIIYYRLHVTNRIHWETNGEVFPQVHECNYISHQ